MRYETHTTFARIVHPDLFHNSPYERSTNEASFALLQSYLTPNDRAGVPDDVSREAIRLRFFLREPDAIYHDNSEAVVSSGFREIHATLPPPIFLDASPPLLAPVCRRALENLLRKCGLAPETDAAQPEASEYQGMRLGEFLREAAEEQRQRQMQAGAGAGPSSITLTLARVQAIRGAFRSQRGILTAFTGSLDVKGQLAALEGLAKAIDRLAHIDFRNVSVVFGGSRNAVDTHNGDVWLSLPGSHEWLQFLSTMSWDLIRDRQRQLASLRTFSRRAAEILGVHRVQPSSAVERSSQYRRLLLEIIEAGRREDGATGLSDVTLLIHERLDEEPARTRVDVQQGAVVVPFPSTVHTIWSALTLLGPAAQSAARERIDERRKVEEIKGKVVRRLRLRSLLKDDALSWSNFNNACRRLLQIDERMLVVTEGLVLRIADKNRVAEDAVEVAWDYEF